MAVDRPLLCSAVAAVVLCTAAAAAMQLPGPTVLGAAVAAAAALARFTTHARRHQQLAAALHRTSVPAVVTGTRVRLAPVDDGAFVSGLWRPAIYCSRDLPATLTADELRAVVLHERAHQRSRDPLRLVLLEVVAPVARLHRRGRAWLERAAAAREIEADRHALAHGASRAALASALLRTAPMSGGRVPGFTSAVDLRLRALLATEEPPRVRRPWRWVAAGAAIAIASCLSAWPLLELVCCW